MKRSADPSADPGSPSPTATGVVMIAMAIAVWWPAFTLGAWGELFFDQILTVWAASTAAFFFVVFDRRPQRRRALKAVALLLPSVWVLLGFIEASSDDPLTLLGDAVGFIAVFFAIPFTIWILVRVMWPEFGSTIPIGSRWVIVLTIAGIAVASFLLGVSHPNFLTCDHFAVSGNSEPPGCTPAVP
ncbi:hypothetical protein LQ757_18910 [Agromyces sp. SYSU K20354]|uniref:hypothetical protein n=1 Tax=Agromyces cavernae TaxID=2898659 RepID=UPI001E46D808|nr:hypothetical protein [Agromyces cavernae]MCD2444356.1 hypothetical protein [Agromyces cavernae]